ncbi:dihydrolipoamide acetyltransferase family protein [Muriicola sp.]|uniref:dihydrolipoamide acetyltransferase family protein n=1 Tax=Muriicola sp. TaxID=2020856 RepID=UPI003C78FC8D
MSKFELKLPQMGESVAEATLTSWLKEVGDTIELDEAVFEIATDKVDSEVPSEVEGVLAEKLFEVDDIIKVGQTVAVIEVKGSESPAEQPAEVAGDAEEEEMVPKLATAAIEEQLAVAKETVAAPVAAYKTSDRFYSPLVKNIANKEQISFEELEAIPGTGLEGRVTKNDILAYLEKKQNGGVVTKPVTPPAQEEKAISVQEEKLPKATPTPKAEDTPHKVTTASATGGDELIPMTRMGKLVAQHMIQSVATSAHVQSFIEVDVTKVVAWRNKVKDAFEKREGEKLTFTPIFIEAVAKALKKFPMVNISVEGDTVIKKKNINIGMAAALPDGNLIVPVIKNADQLNLVGMAKVVNDLANRARNNALKPDEIKEGTYTVTNVGTFGSVFGTPIINQPQVGILALGAIRKMPAVIETSEGDFIGIRSKMFLSHSYDHRVVNGALGGMFVKAVADYLEDWDSKRDI